MEQKFRSDENRCWRRERDEQAAATASVAESPPGLTDSPPFQYHTLPRDTETPTPPWGIGGSEDG